MGYNSKSRKIKNGSEKNNYSKKKKSAFRNKNEYKEISKQDIQDLIEEDEYDL